MRWGFFIFFGFLCVSAFGDTLKIAACYRQLPALSRTIEGDRARFQRLSDLHEISNWYLGHAKEKPSLHEWAARNRRRGSRAFRLYPEENQNSAEMGAYFKEAELVEQIQAARAAVKANPKDSAAHEKLAKLVGEILERTGVPNEVRKGSGEQWEVLVKPLSSAEWESEQQRRFGKVPEDGAPLMTKLAERTNRRKLGVVFDSDKLANDGGYFRREAHISLGLSELVDPESVWLHEAEHDAHEAARNQPWTIENSHPEGTLRRRLPQIEISGSPTDRELKGTFYEKSFLIEEAQCCYRQAVFHMQRSRELQAIAKRLGLPRAKELAKEHARLANSRIDWIHKFSMATNGYFHPVSAADPYDMHRERFTIRKSYDERWDVEVSVPKVGTFRIPAGAIPGYDSKASGRKGVEESRQIFLKWIEDVRLSVIHLEMDAGSLRSELRKDFPELYPKW